MGSALGRRQALCSSWRQHGLVDVMKGIFIFITIAMYTTWSRVDVEILLARADSCREGTRTV